ncbi:MAG: methyltransferase domain-containing protein [Desulfobacterales bacterium]|nr:methyltransferase domain-containing protein [Desulfobacterales bacterium]
MSDQYKEFPCDICGSKDAEEVPYAKLYSDGQEIHICKKCGFVYVKYRRDSDSVAKTWDKIYSSDVKISTPYSPKIPAVKARQTYVAEFLDVNLGLDGKKIVDIGAGDGQFLKIVKDNYDASVFGVEPYQNNCDKMNSNSIDCFCGTIESYCDSKDYQKADIATIMWTLENCASCRDMLFGARNLLKEDGYVIVATGSRILVPFKKPLQNYIGTNPADTHCFRFSANTLRALLAVNGFETVYINRYIDTDHLCVIGQKKPEDSKIEWQGDDFLSVYDFFERWHKENIYYLNNKGDQ